ncbi:MAG: GNAT family protein [Lysobacterales bacterium]
MRSASSTTTASCSVASASIGSTPGSVAPASATGSARRNAAGPPATRAAAHAAAFGFDELELARIEIVALPDNVASQRVAEKLGALREGVFRNRIVLAGGARDAVVFSLVPGATLPG